MSEERFFKIESKLDSHDKDLHSIARSLAGIDKHMEKTNQLIQESYIKDEKFTSRINSVELTLLSKLETNAIQQQVTKTKVDKIETVFNKLVWIVVTVVILGVIGASLNFK